jgi:proline racemase/DNA-binding transcriptional MerR regulator/quercetin dioxygenase-like cupin family protein
MSDLERDEARKPFSIGHVTKITGINASTLRSWEQQGLIAPAKSGGGRRTFNQNDILRIQEIDRLRRVYGYSLAGVKRALDGSRPTPSRAANGEADHRVDLIGGRVRALRVAAGLTLRQLAQQTGLAASHLSMFERGVAFPSPSRLNAIAKVFNRTLADLLGSTRMSGRPIIRKGRGRIVGSFGPGVTVEQLTVGEELMDCEIWTIRPGAESDGFYAHDGQELLHILEGELELALDGGEPEMLHAGDSAYFNSTRQHRWRNPNSHAAVVLWVNTDSKRVASINQHTARKLLDLGAPIGRGIGEQAHALQLSDDSRSYRVIDTHTAGHPTRVLIEPLEGLEGHTVREKREHFVRQHDGLRTLLLHEPRGHAATFGLVPVQSESADFGAIFISSYKYLDMCGHGTIGYARVLDALGRLNGGTSFSLEVPAGVVHVRLGLHGSNANVSVENVASWVALENLPLPEIAPDCTATIAYGGCWYANVDARALGISIAPDNVSRLMQLGARIKEIINDRLSKSRPDLPQIDSTLFYEDDGRGRARQLVILESNKFDRSPCGTGMSARMAELALHGRLRVGDTYEVENVLGVPFLGHVLAEAAVGGQPAIVPQVTGKASLSGFSTLIVEADDPLRTGFLCR